MARALGETFWHRFNSILYFLYANALRWLKPPVSPAWGEGGGGGAEVSEQLTVHAEEHHPGDPEVRVLKLHHGSQVLGVFTSQALRAGSVHRKWPLLVRTTEETLEGLRSACAFSPNRCETAELQGKVH